MDLISRGKDVQLRLFLTDTDLLSVFRSRQGRAPSRISNPINGDLEPRQAAGKSSRGKSEVLACYSSSSGTLTLSGVLHDRLPVNFVLKPGTKTYGNFLKFFLREINSLSGGAGESVELPNPSGEYHDLLKGLKTSLQCKLVDLNISDFQNSGEGADIIEVYRSDFESAQPKKTSLIWDIACSRKKRNGFLESKAFEAVMPPKGVFEKPFAAAKRQFHFFADQKRVTPQLISGFLSLEIGEADASVSSGRKEALLGHSAQDIQRELRSSLVFLGAPVVEVKGSVAEVNYRFRLAPELLGRVEFFVHWGSYSGNSASPEWWTDEEVIAEEITESGDGVFSIRKQLACSKNGSYGATCYVQAEGLHEPIWASQAGCAEDARFYIDEFARWPADDSARRDIIEQIDIEGRLLQGLASFESFVRTISQLSRSASCRGLGKLLFDVTHDNPVLRSLVSDYYQRAVIELDQRETRISKSRLKAMLSVVRNVGIGEVVFVAPEGPHAIAGGLAQVIVGLTKSLSRCGISCTVITPLYEESQGNKHASARELLLNGVQVVDKRVPLKRIGEVKISFGGTQHVGTNNPWHNPRTVRSAVYLAENEGVRIIFLRHRKLASRLYAAGWADDQIRRALFLSRGALEVLRDRKFNITPHIIVTNDWPTAFVPILLRTDPRYKQDRRFSGVETVHIMHNCGQGYQGRFPLNQFGEDLWPMLGIAGEHYFGLSDPAASNLLNLTAGAVLHSNKALVAVSKPYARQLLSKKGGEGLHEHFIKNEKGLFGVSNGVDLVALRRLFWNLGEEARKELGLTPLIKARMDHKRLAKNLPEYKRATKLIVQKKHSLHQDENAILISLIGRLAEQKGIQLLAGKAEYDTCSVLEAVLKEYPQVQFFIGGPPSEGDSTVRDLQAVISELSLKYPGRIKAVFNFIAHRDALEITQASDIFLMPSRYEPGGITQLEAMAAGTLVVARNVGGIAATLVDYSSERNEGDSFLFREFSSSALKSVICRALATISDRKTHQVLIARTALSEHDWSHRVPKYLSILQHVAGVFDKDSSYPHLSARWHLLNSLRPSF